MVPGARRALSQPHFGGQDLPKPRESQLLQGARNPALRSGTGASQEGRNQRQGQDYRDECERVEVERRFSLAKRKCGMGLVTAKLRETAAHVIAMSILVLNLRKIQCAILQLLVFLRAFFSPNPNWTFVQ